jgi:DNA-binding Lrp family transcriptional regulator
MTGPIQREFFQQQLHDPNPEKTRAQILNSIQFKFTTESLRTQEVEWIKQQLTRTPDKIYKRFVAVLGPEGVGKSTTVDWALKDIQGVIDIDVQPGTSSDEILDRVATEITGLSGTFAANKRFLKSVVDCYNATYQQPLVVIIRARQRGPGERHAQVSQASRSLADIGINALNDCSDNAYPELLSGRENILNMEPMSSDMLRKLPGTTELFETLDATGDAQLVLAVCGGVPLVLEDFVEVLLKSTTDQKREAVRNLALLKLTNAQDRLDQFASTHPKANKV